MDIDDLKFVPDFVPDHNEDSSKAKIQKLYNEINNFDSNDEK